MSSAYSPSDRLRIAKALGDRRDAELSLFFQAYGLGKAYLAPGRSAGRQAKIASALHAAELEGRAESMLAAAEAEFNLSSTVRDELESFRDPFPTSKVDDMPTAGREIFISHAYADHQVAGLLAKLVVMAGINQEKIFYSSRRSTGVPSGKNVLAELKKALSEARIVIEMVSDSYLVSPLCLMEFGAAWALDKRTLPVALPPIDRDGVAGRLGGIHMARLGVGDAGADDVTDFLNDLHGHLTSIKANIAQDSWKEATDEFRERLSLLLSPKSGAKASVDAGRPTPIVALGHPPARDLPPRRTGSSLPRASADARSDEPNIEDLAHALSDMRDGLRALKRFSRKVLLYSEFKREPYQSLPEDEGFIREALDDCEVQQSSDERGWVPNDEIPEVDTARSRMRQFRQLLLEVDEAEASAMLGPYKIHDINLERTSAWGHLKLL